MVDTDVHKRGERGRPRSGTSHRPDLSATEQILDAAARLFVERGYAATSTRAIADAVGIRQASLYYHFANKEQILEVLLMRTVEPSMRVAHHLEAAPAASAVRLYALVAFDTRQLFTATHNVGTLYLLPEIRNELFEPFRAKRATLREVYARLIADSIATPVRVELGPARGSQARSSLDYLVDVIFGMVESAIAIRADRPHDDSNVLVTTIAQSCLRVLGHDSDAIRGISAEAERVLAAMHETLAVTP
ncbi:MAG TPA: TetR family transcriptional regulator [Microbacteriaceae bacterium]|jgi:AcrR family transcriptional regulator|nr:TetR family transcriptional regulator [Microbacteriaceae bacterium]